MLAVNASSGDDQLSIIAKLPVPAFNARRERKVAIMMRLRMSVLALAVWPAALSAQQPAPVAPPSPGKIVVTGKAKKVCETSASLGSIIPTRICKTQEEWDEIHERSLVQLGRMQDAQMFRDNAQRHKADGNGSGN